MIPPIDHRDRRWAVLLCLGALLLYNANLRLIAAGDSYPARFIPFALWSQGSLYLDPVIEATIQRHPAPYWVVDTLDGKHKASLYPVVTPLLVAPLYLPAVLDLQLRGWPPRRLDALGRLMEKGAASLVAALAAGWMFLLLRRRLDRGHALLLAGLFAFGTSTWSTSSQALWQHGPGELFAVAALWSLTAAPTPWRALGGGLAAGLLVANRPPDLPLALAFGIAALLWAGRRVSLSALFAAAAALPIGFTVTYNLVSFGRLAGGYETAGVVSRSFFSQNMLEGIAGLLVSPARGLFVYTPFLLLVGAGLLQGWRDRSQRPLTLCLAGGCAGLLLVYAPVDFLQGAVYGPRFLTDALPLLVWLAAPALPHLGRWARIAFLAAGAFSVGAQVVGAFFYSGGSNLAFVATPAEPEARKRAWSPRHCPILTEARWGTWNRDLLPALRTLGETPVPIRRRSGLPSDFFTLLPCRILDTRWSRDLEGGTTRRFPVAGSECGIPEDAIAISGSAAVVGEEGEGRVHLQALPGRAGIEIHFAAGTSRSIFSILPLAPDGSLRARVSGTGRTRMAVDVTGYFAAPEPAAEFPGPSGVEYEARP